MNDKPRGPVNPALEKRIIYLSTLKRDRVQYEDVINDAVSRCADQFYRLTQTEQHDVGRVIAAIDKLEEAKQAMFQALALPLIEHEGKRQKTAGE